jgi:SSS family solute:Na+ symporter
VATGLYTLLGGLRAVIYTDLVQLFVLIGGSVAVSAYGLAELGGWGAMVDAVSLGAGEPNTYFNLWRPASDPDYPWTGILFGAPILGIWYWCTDQFIVQRVLSAKSETQARRGAMFGGGLKLLPLFLFLIPGIIIYALSVTQDPGMLIGADGVSNPDRALPAMVLRHLPAGIRGLVTAGMLAALMSSLSSVFNSCSTLLTFDFYQRHRPAATEKQLVRFGRWSTAALVVLGLAWIPLMQAVQQGGGLFRYLQEVQAYISPPIAAVFLLGLFFPRLNAKGAVAALWTGFVLGIGKLVGLFYAEALTFGPGTAPWWMVIVDINFLHYAGLLFVVCAIVFVAVSRANPEPSQRDLTGLVWDGGVLKGNRTDAILTALLIAAVGILWLIFSPLGIA